ncbi:MAG: hypothetical protein ACXU8N_04020 [Telluria sp.]
MKKLFLSMACLLAACSSKPLPPAWEMNAHGSVKAFEDAYLRGDTGIADTEFAHARADVASTGRPDLVAKVELIRCATHGAALEADDCPGYLRYAGDALPEERAYAAYIAGRFAEVNAAALPEQHRAVVATGSFAAVQDPLARLVAAGALFRAGRISPADIALAVDTASAQGWRRPLLAWLGVQEARARAAGDSAAVAAIRKRIDLAAGT